MLNFKQQKKSLKKKSSSLGVELQPLVDVDSDHDTAFYGSPDEYSSLETPHSLQEQENNATNAEPPRAVQLMRPENLAIPACYLCVGLMQGAYL